MSEVVVRSFKEQQIYRLKAKIKQLEFEYKTLAKLTYDYLCMGERIITKEELKDMAQKALEE